MKKTFKRISALLFAVIIAAAMTVTSLAATGYNTDANPTEDTTSFTLTKHYNAAGDTANESSPAENFVVTFTPYQVNNTPASAAITTDNMPSIANATISAAVGAAGGDVTAEVTLPTYTAVGDYWYKVAETAGTTAGVTYDDAEYYLHVQVIRDADASTTLLRLVTLHTAAPDADGTPADSGDTKNDGFTNTYSNGSLSVTKKVTGNMGDIDKVYTATVVFTYASDEAVNPVKSVISYTDGEAKTVAPSAWTKSAADEPWTTTVTIELSHDETVTFTNIPYGVAYTVTEQDYTDEGYTHTMAFTGNEAADTVATGTAWADVVATGTVEDAADSLTITNDKSTAIDVGVIVENAPFVAAFIIAASAIVAVIVSRRRKASDR